MGPPPTLPVTAGRRRASSRSGGVFDEGVGRCFYRLSITLMAAAGLATLVTFTMINAYMHGLGPGVPGATDPTAAPFGFGTDDAIGASSGSARLLAMIPPGGVKTISSGRPEINQSDVPPLPKPFHHPFPGPEYRIFHIPEHDDSPRCQQSKICDGDHSCGPDGLGCVVSALERQKKIREAIRWSWQGYRQGGTWVVCCMGSCGMHGQLCA